jgi:hypothetical protein
LQRSTGEGVLRLEEWLRSGERAKVGPVELRMRLDMSWGASEVSS